MFKKLIKKIINLCFSINSSQSNKQDKLVSQSLGLIKVRMNLEKQNCRQQPSSYVRKPDQIQTKEKLVGCNMSKTIFKKSLKDETPILNLLYKNLVLNTQDADTTQHITSMTDKQALETECLKRITRLEKYIACSFIKLMDRVQIDLLDTKEPRLIRSLLDHYQNFESSVDILSDYDKKNIEVVKLLREYVTIKHQNSFIQSDPIHLRQYQLFKDVYQRIQTALEKEMKITNRKPQLRFI